MIYTYQCQSCQHVFDVTKKLAEIDRVEVCGECNAEVTTRVIAPPGFTSVESLGRRKAPAEFRDWLRVLHKNTPGSKMELD